MPQKAEIRYPTVAKGARVDATKDRNKIFNSGRGGSIDATNTTNMIPNSVRGREDGCHKRQKEHIQQWQREGGWMPQKGRNKIPNNLREGGGGAFPAKDRNKISNSGRGREDGCHKRQKYNTEHWQPEGGWLPQRTEIRYQKFHIQQWQREGGWMPQKTEMKYPTAAQGGRMDATQDRDEILNNGRGRMDATKDRVPEGGRVDATKDRKTISNSGRGREGGCHKRQKENIQRREDGCHKRQK